MLAPVDPKRSRRRVLIADDNRDAAESLAALLHLEGHDVAVVYDGAAALAHILSESPDMALLDIGMPQISGYEVARQVRLRSPNARIRLVALTGWGQDSDKAKALAAGFDHHFTKPIEPSVLFDLISAEQPDK